MRSRTRSKASSVEAEAGPAMVSISEHPSGLAHGEKAVYLAERGAAYAADAAEFLRLLPDSSVNLVITSPPYALHFKKEYGNVDKADYVRWFRPVADQVRRVLTEDGSFVLNIGGSYNPGRPTRSLYHFRLLLELCEVVDFRLAQECFWYNPAKLPTPAEWVNVRRLRIKDSVEYLWWLSKSDWPKADNTRVLGDYSQDMRRLIKNGYRAKTRPSGHVITTKFGRDRGGSIPANLISQGNNESNSAYIRACQEAGHKPHPARFPKAIPEFFIKFLTDEDDLVVDPFAGSNMTGAVAEELGRRWIAIDVRRDYVESSAVRFSPQARLPL